MQRKAFPGSMFTSILLVSRVLHQCWTKKSVSRMRHVLGNMLLVAWYGVIGFQVQEEYMLVSESAGSTLGLLFRRTDVP